MSRSITAITPKNLANKSIEDLIDNLTLQSLDVSGGTIDFTNATIDVTGATIIGASALIPDPLMVNTITERTAGSNLTINNTTADILIVGDRSVDLFTSGIITPGGHIINIATAGDSSDLVQILSEGNLKLQTISGYVAQTIDRAGGSNNNDWTSQNAGQNGNSFSQLGQIAVGSFFRAFIPANSNVGNANVSLGATYIDPPLVVIGCSNPRVGVAANNINTTTFDIDWRELVGSNQNNVVASWIVIGRVS